MSPDTHAQHCRLQDRPLGPSIGTLERVWQRLKRDVALWKRYLLKCLQINLCSRSSYSFFDKNTFILFTPVYCLGFFSSIFCTVLRWSGNYGRQGTVNHCYGKCYKFLRLAEIHAEAALG